MIPFLVVFFVIFFPDVASTVVRAEEVVSCLACGGNGEHGYAAFIRGPKYGDDCCWSETGEYQVYDAANPPRCHSNYGTRPMFCECPSSRGLTAKGNERCRWCEVDREKILFRIGMLSGRYYCVDPSSRNVREGVEPSDAYDTECAHLPLPDENHTLYNPREAAAFGSRDVACECSDRSYIEEFSEYS